MEYGKELNDRRFPIGSVVYYTVMNNCKQEVKYGIVHDHYSNGIVITCLYNKNNIMIKGIYDKDYISIDDFQTSEKWYKLPKGWTYNTTLIKWFKPDWSEEIKNELSVFNYTDSNAILKAYKLGVLVDAEHNCFDHFETEITKNGWRIVRKSPSYGEPYHPQYVTIYPYEVYSTYEEAKKVCDDYKAELDRIANLSDYDWSVEQIDKNINKLLVYNVNSKDLYEAWRKFLLSQNNVEDIETRCWLGRLQWKYCHNKKWLDIEVNI